MSITFTTNQQGTSDYKKYVWGNIVKTDRYKDSTLLDFALVPFDAAFVKPLRGTYITINSAKYPNWFTGYIINEPELSYLGSRNKQPVWGYKYQATSDEYVLSLKPLGIVAPFMNMTMGEILKSLVSKLVPGTFDVSGIEAGSIVSQYVVDPSKKFFDVVKDFCESASFSFRGNNKKLYFRPQDSSEVVIDGSNAHFTPSRLSIKPASAGSGVINDVTVLGSVEPQSYITEYMVGTGLDAVFPLASGVFGVDASVLLDEAFSGSSIDSSKWTIHDQPSMYITLGNGYTLVNGGAPGYGVNMQSKSMIPLEGKLRFTHGDWRLTSGDGVIGGLWTEEPNEFHSGCVYGLHVGGGVVSPIINGSVDNSQTLALSASSRYVIRTIAEFKRSTRTIQEYKYINHDGAVDSFGGDTYEDAVTWETLISEVDPSDGAVIWQTRFINTAVLNTSVVYARYVPVASASLDAAFTGITISVPVNAFLGLATKCALSNTSFDSWVDDTTPSGWTALQGCSKEATVVDSGFSLKMTANSSGAAFIEQSAAGLVLTDKLYRVFTRLRKSAGLSQGDVVFSFIGTDVNYAYTIPVTSLSSGAFEYFIGQISAGFPTAPEDLVFRISLVGVPEGGVVYVDSVTVITDFETKLIGPNEIDGLDGVAPAATIISGNAGGATRSTYLGVPQYNPGQSELVFFKDSSTMTSDVPPENQIIRLSYRSAGPAIGRAVDRASMLAESVNWGDDGVRSAIHTDIVPRPRTSAECEAAAAALVAENSRVHYEGDYTQWSDYFTEEPVSGSILRFINLSSMAPVSVEEINEVVTTLESEKPTDRFNHRISFGKPDISRTLLDKIAKPAADFQRSAESQPNEPIDTEALRAGGVYAGDVTNPSLLAWTPTKLYIDAGEELTSDDLYFEVRYTDEGWGVDAGLNLVARTVNRFINVPRSLRGRTYFIRKARKGNLIQWSEDQTQNNYSGPTRTKALKAGPDGKSMQVTSLTLGAGASLSGSLSAYPAGNYCGSISIKGPAGASLRLTLGGTPTDFVTTGYWQRVSCTTPGSPAALTLTNMGASAAAIEVTRASVEAGLVETHYAKTTSVLYGPTSRYSACVKVSFPAEDVLITESAAVVKSPLDYGAVGDGVTDDTSAVAQCAVENEAWVVPAGYTFLIDGLQLTDKPRVNISGSGTLKAKGNSPFGTTVLELLEIGEVTINGVILSGNRYEQSGTPSSCLRLMDCPVITLDNVAAGDALLNGCSIGYNPSYAGSNPAIQITNSWFDSNEAAGLAIQSDAPGAPPTVTLSGVSAYANAVRGFQFRNLSWVSVTGCLVNSSDVGVLLWDSSAMFTGCTFNTAVGVEVVGNSTYTAYNCRGVADRYLLPGTSELGTFTVDATAPTSFTATFAIAAMPANSIKVSYGIQWYTDPSGEIPDGVPMWIGNLENGILESTFEGQKTTLSYARGVFMSFNASGNGSPVFTSPNVEIVPAAEGVGTEPEATQLSASDWSTGTIQSATDPQDGYQYAGIPLLVTIPADAEFVQLYKYRGASPPANLSLFELTDVTILKGNNTAVVWWIPCEQSAYTLQLALVASTDLRLSFPSVTTVVKSVVVPAVSLAEALTNPTVTIQPLVIGGVQHARFAMSAGYNISDKNLRYIVARKRTTDASYQNPGRWEIFWYATPGKEFPLSSPFSDSQREYWPVPSTVYCQAELGTVNFAGLERWSGVINNLSVTTDGKVDASQLKNLGSGTAIRNGQLVGTNRGGLENPDFLDGLTGWTVGEATTWESTGGLAGDGVVRMTASGGAYRILYQLKPLVDGQSKRLVCRLKNNTNTAINVSAVYRNNLGAVLGGQTISVSAAADWQTINVFPGFAPTGSTDAEKTAQLMVYVDFGGGATGGSVLVDYMDIEDVERTNTTTFGRDSAGNVLLNSGALSDLSKYNNTARPFGIGTADPPLPNSAYPIGSFFYRTDINSLKRNVGNTWTGTPAEEIITGTLGAAVAYVGNLVAGQVKTGQLSGISLFLDANEVQTSITNDFDSYYGAYIGLKVQVKGSEQRSLVTAGGAAGLFKDSVLTTPIAQWELAGNAANGGSFALRGPSMSPTSPYYDTSVIMYGALGQIGLKATSTAYPYGGSAGIWIWSIDTFSPPTGSYKKVLGARAQLQPTSIENIALILKAHGLCI